MSKTPDIKRSFLRYAALATALFVVFLFIKRDNVLRWIQAGFTIRRQERQIELLREENGSLDRRIESMSGNRDTLETFARENFFFSRPDEDVYIISQD